MGDHELLMRFLEPIEESYRLRTKRSAELHARAREFLPGGNSRSTTYFSPHPLYIERAEGCRLHDVDGNVLVDFLGNFTSMILGHSHPKVREAVECQLREAVSPGACTENIIELASMIRERYPSMERLRFCNSGTEANLYALKAARAFTGREKLIVMEGAYHGGYDWFNIGFNLDPETLSPLPDPSIPRSVSNDVLLV
ncbi:MAG: aminotransferase class III-fold pyridoxal phosphate-dependent enzyme, partial [Nitrospinota bacterium]